MDKHPISPDSNTAESFSKIVIREMITDLQSFDY